ncbi:MAG: hypothetical protein HOW73_15920 [Polyangiaceae bacterium]|nr:hypothetical protein [Polyangiaceae bacterium]
MTPRPSSLIAALSIIAASLAFGGCGNPCVALCEDSKECPEADVSTNCEQACETAKEGVQSLDCFSQYEDMIDCQAGFDDVCAPDTSCDELVATFNDCVIDACADDPENEFCG